MSHAKALKTLFDEGVVLPSIPFFLDHAKATIEIEDTQEGQVYVITFRDNSVGRFTTKYWVED